MLPNFGGFLFDLAHFKMKTVDIFFRKFFFNFDMVQKSSFISFKVPHKIWAWSVQPFRLILDEDRQTDKKSTHMEALWCIRLDRLIVRQQYLEALRLGQIRKYLEALRLGQIRKYLEALLVGQIMKYLEALRLGQIRKYLEVLRLGQIRKYLVALRLGQIRKYIEALRLGLIRKYLEALRLGQIRKYSKRLKERTPQWG